MRKLSRVEWCFFVTTRGCTDVIKVICRGSRSDCSSPQEKNGTQAALYNWLWGEFNGALQSLQCAITYDL